MEKETRNVLMIEGLAACPRMPKATRHKLVREGKIPCAKIGRHWRFRKGAIDHWLEETRANEPGSGRDR